METTRRYPRTLGEAFKGADYACAIERTPRRRNLFPALAIILTCVFLVGIAAR